MRTEAPETPPGCSPSKLEWNRAKSYCHLYDAQGYSQLQAYIQPLAMMNLVGLDLTQSRSESPYVVVMWNQTLQVLRDANGVKGLHNGMELKNLHSALSLYGLKAKELVAMKRTRRNFHSCNRFESLLSDFSQPLEIAINGYS
ncbi:hypothetical protein TNCV_2987321 [Trichonephila clavipes]|nr:hypothetical protein TNCV_2987321 [Trichonephila clavipes]